MASILSTKKLKPLQKEVCAKAGLAVTDYDALRFLFPEFDLPDGYHNLIFTSQNGVRAYLKHLDKHPNALKEGPPKFFCVGRKTAEMLIVRGWDISHIATNAEALAHYIVQNYPGDAFLFLCGNLRREELSAILNKHGISLRECTVYTTELHPIQQQGPFDGVLFFSPSGVESFFSLNSIGPALALCIGPTTAEAVQKYTKRYVIAIRPSAEALIRLAIQELIPGNDLARDPGSIENDTL